MRKTILIFSLMLSFAVAASAESLDGVRKAFVEAAAENCSPSDELTERFVQYSSKGRANDVLLLQLYNYIHIPDAEVDRLLENFDREQGCWKDIDYTAQDRGSWPSTLHVTRMYSLCKLYTAGDSAWKGNEELGRLLHLTMNWWFVNMPKCPNWWHNDIGVPKKMTTVLLMMRDELSPEEVQGGLKVLERSKFGRTGQNKVWLAGNNLMKGLLIDDPALVKQARDYIAEEIYITPEEGIQEDWSFHQHGPQIQFGNYGLTYADVLSFWIRVLEGSEYAFTPEQTAIVSNLMRKGICRSVWKGVMDPSFCGRQNFIDGGPGKAFALAVAAHNMAEALDGEDAAFFANVAKENLQSELYDNSLVGGSYYWRSDCGIWRTPDWYASIRMHSDRTIGFEFTNNENTLANFSADGALILMQDGKEFENIFAYWDWRKVPGVTAYDDGRAIKCDDSVEGKKNHTGHVAGVVADRAMAATMELSRDGIHAFKSAFFFDDCVVNLGSDIRTTRDDLLSLTTGVDQIHLDGKVYSGKNYIQHDNRGYVSLDGAPVRVSVGVQKGKWDDIDPAFHDKWDEGAVFKAWFEHPLDKVSTYAYALVPCADAMQVKAFAGRVGTDSDKALRVLRNDADCQALLYKGMLCAVFHKAGEYELDGETYHIARPSIKIFDGTYSWTAVIDLDNL